MLKQWALSICAAAVAVGIIQMTLPSMKLKNAITTVLSLLLLITIVSPIIKFANTPIDFDAQPPSSGQIELSAEDYALEAVRYSLVSKVKNILSQIGINGGEVRIDIDVTGSAYNVTSITVYLPAEYESLHDDTIARLRADLGQAVYISYSGGDEK